jgi:hypothetical protein
VDCRNSVATLSQLCRNFAQLCRNSVATLSQLCATLSQLCRNSVATLSQLCRNSVATLSQLCRNFAQLCRNFAQLCATRSQKRLHFPFLQRAKLLVREPVLGANRSHSHSLIQGVHGEDLNGGGNELTTLVRFYVARCSQGVGS